MEHCLRKLENVFLLKKKIQIENTFTFIFNSYFITYGIMMCYFAVKASSSFCIARIGVGPYEGGLCSTCCACHVGSVDRHWCRDLYLSLSASSWVLCCTKPHNWFSIWEVTLEEGAREHNFKNPIPHEAEWNTLTGILEDKNRGVVAAVSAWTEH